MNAIQFLNGTVLENSAGVVYYDSSTRQHYLSPMADLPWLDSLLSAGADASTAYTYWRKECNHSRFSFPDEM